MKAAPNNKCLNKRRVFTISRGHFPTGINGSLRRQNGSALALSLLVLVLVTTVAYYAQQHHWRFQRQVQLLNSADRSLYYLYSAEILASQLLKQDASRSKSDHLQEPWAKAQPRHPLEHGSIQLSLEDLQGRFNINRLAKSLNPQSNNPILKFSPDQKRFIRLLQTTQQQSIDQDQAIAITEAVIDWLDADDEVNGLGGFESLNYQTLEHSPVKYQAANRLFSDVSELRLIHNIPASLYHEIKPLLSALPANASLNINTASPQILRSLNHSSNLEPLSLSDVDILVGQQRGGFSNLEQVKAAFPNQQIDTDELSLSSDYFDLYSQIKVGDRQSFYLSSITRNNNTASVLRRQLNTQPKQLAYNRPSTP